MLVIYPQRRSSVSKVRASIDLAVPRPKKQFALLADSTASRRKSAATAVSPRPPPARPSLENHMKCSIPLTRPTCGTIDPIPHRTLLRWTH